MTLTDERTPEAPESAAAAGTGSPADSSRSRVTAWVVEHHHLLLIGAVVILYAFYFTPPAASAHLRNDIGVQLHLSIETANGAMPIRDFYHGWNMGGWYVGALMYRLVGGDPGLWMVGWIGVTGLALQAIASTIIAHRARVGRAAIVAIALGCAFVIRVPNGKYSVPALWVLAIVFTRELPFRRRAIAYALCGGITVLLHVELAGLCAFGTVLAETFHVGNKADLRRGFQAAFALGTGIAIAIGLEVALLASQGLGAREAVELIFPFGPSDSSGTEKFGWLLGRPGNIVAAFFPLLILAPFVPSVFQRLSPITRLVAFVNLSLTIIALQRADAAHLYAMAAMIPLQIALVLRDVAASDERPKLDPTPVDLLVIGVGAAWAAGSVMFTFNASGLVIVPFLAATALVGVLVGTRVRPVAWSSGALVILALVGIVGTGMREREERRTGSTAYPIAEQYAAEFRPLADQCTGGSDDVFIMPGPPIYYEALAYENPTPYYLFWTAGGRRERVLTEMLDTGEVQNILIIGGMPGTMAALSPIMEEKFDRCIDQEVIGVRSILFTYRG